MKVSWNGKIISIQPRIRLLRSFDERSHNYMGYVLYLAGEIDGQEREFSVGIGKAAYAKHECKIGDIIKGDSHPVLDSRVEIVEFYKASKLEIVERSGDSDTNPPPWIDVLPLLEIYRERGHRRLDVKTFNSKCRQCIWGCLMPGEMTIDQWKPETKQ